MAIPGVYQPFVEDIHDMIGFSEADLEAFHQHQGFFVDNLEILINFIASVVTDHGPSRVVFEEGRGDLESLKRRLGAWLAELLNAHDTPDFWHRQFIISIEHIVRKIPNRQMVCLSTRIREVVLPMMLEQLGQIEGLKLFLAFQRLLDSIVALTTTLVDEGRRRCLLEASGFTPVLLENLEAMVFDKIRAELSPS